MSLVKDVQEDEVFTVFVGVTIFCECVDINCLFNSSAAAFSSSSLSQLSSSDDKVRSVCRFTMSSLMGAKVCLFLTFGCGSVAFSTTGTFSSRFFFISSMGFRRIWFNGCSYRDFLLFSADEIISLSSNTAIFRFGLMLDFIFSVVARSFSSSRFT